MRSPPPERPARRSRSESRPELVSLRAPPWRTRRRCSARGRPELQRGARQRQYACPVSCFDDLRAAKYYPSGDEPKRVSSTESAVRGGFLQKAVQAPSALRRASSKRAREIRWAERESNPHSQRRLIYR